MTSCGENWQRLALVALGFVLAITLSNVLIWSVMYPAAMRWNTNSAETECTVVEQLVINHTCTQGGSAIMVYPCYGAAVNLSYTVLDLETNVSTTYISTFALSSRSHVWESEYDWLQRNYPLGQAVQCWYNVFDPSEVRLNLVSKSAYVGSTIVVVIGWILGCTCLAFGVWD